MKKLFTLSFILLSIAFNAFSQDLGYRTLDVGTGYQHVKDGMEINLLVSINAEIHHALVIRGGYRKFSEGKTPLHNGEDANAWGGSIGYRYHFSVVPKGFFVGANAGLWNATVNWSVTESEGSSKMMTFQPAVETGYTILINDIFFITPHATASYVHVLSTTGQKINLAKSGFVPTGGITMGWRF